MKRGGLLAVLLTVLFVVFAPMAAFGEATTINLQSIVLESFNANQTGSPQYGWYAQGSKFVTKGYPKWTYAHAWPLALNGTNPQNPNLRVLGVNAKFDRQGYNRIDIFPIKVNSKGTPVRDSNGNVIPEPIQIPGVCKTLDVWVWGSNHNYTMDVEVEDYTGQMHVLPLGSLDFAGWEDLMVQIPPSIPQTVETIPHLRGLKIVKFMIWTKPAANVSDFYVYLDQLKVLTDVSQRRIDGQNLANPSRVAQIWSGSGVTQGK